MKKQLLLTLTAAACALGITTHASAQGYIITNTGEQVVKAPTSPGVHDDGITQLYGPRQEFLGLGDRDDVVQLHVNHQAIYIDPDKDYLSRTPGRIDHNHSIVRAQRAYQARHAQPTRVLRRSTLQPTDNGRLIQPSMIILKPDYLERRQRKNAPRPMIPIVPRQTQKQGELMAAAE